VLLHVAACRECAHQPCHPEHSEAESRDPVANLTGDNLGSLDFARDDERALTLP
jgi:hypothetical protein